jgi:hypothetical protein
VPQTVADVLNQLVAEGLAPPEALTRARKALEGVADPGPPWYARVIAGFGAWVATGCLIGFLVVLDLVDSGMDAIVVGAILVVGANARRGPRRDQEFMRQLSLAASLAGQVLLIVGLRAETESTALAGLAAIVMSVGIVALVDEPADRFMAALIGSVALIAVMGSFALEWRLGSLGPLGTIVVRGSDIGALGVVALTAYAWRVGIRTRSREREEMLEPVAYGVVAGLLIVLTFSSWFVALGDLIRGERTAASAWVLGPLTTLGIAAGVAILAERICHELGVRRLMAATPLLLALVTLSTPGIIAAVALFVLGFDRRNRVLIALGIAFLVKFLALYYYSLDMTLLEKSIVLAASGLVLLAARAYIELGHRPREDAA